ADQIDPMQCSVRVEYSLNNTVRLLYERDFVVGRQNIVLDSPNRPSWVRAEGLERPQPGYIPGALIARRAAFDTIGYFDETMRHGGDDTDWFARARRTDARCVMLEQTVLIRHAHENNLSSDAQSSNQELLALVRRHVAEWGRK
ncbi:MAG: hypothetical protein ABL886_08730, partial [Rhodoglobus sp.]